MRQCYFCKTRKGLKQIWLEDDIEDGHDDKKRACCRECYIENELEDYEDFRDTWYTTDYFWQTKEEGLRDKQKTLEKEGISK